MANRIIELIGNTPLIKLKAASEETGCDVFGKAEFLNPGGSVKDRAAYSIVNQAIKEKQLRPGGIIVEGTAGNTGIGLTLVANCLGFQTKIITPDTQSQEKLNLLAASGASLVTVPAAPYKDENNYIRYSKKLANQINESHPEGAFWANQFDNLANKRAHFETTGPEIWNQTEGQIDAFVSAVGTGGTLAGVTEFLRTKKNTIISCLADPPGAALFDYYTKGNLCSSGSSITEGIGQGRITENLKGLEVNYAFKIPDQETIDILFSLAKDEGLFLGGSAGVNVAAAIRLGKIIGPGHCIVTILCDSGTRYLSKLYNPDFLRSKKLEPASWL